MASVGSMSAGNAPAMNSMGGNSPPEATGANTFAGLKGLFKQQYAKCKHCGKSFIPKTGITNKSPAQKEAAAINASKGPRI